MSSDPSVIAPDEIAEARRALLDDARPDAVERQHKRAAMTARERVSYLTDDNSFREVGGLVCDDGGDRASRPADGVVTGTARIDGRPVMIAAQDFTVHGGSSGILGSAKMRRAVEGAIREGCPMIFLLDGGGHRIQDGQDSRHFANGSPMFHNMARISGWVPVVSAMLGAGFAGPTNYAGMSDFVVMVRDQSCMGLAGPALVKAGTGEEIDIQSLGGAAAQVDRHGLADLGVDSETEALDAVRSYLSYLPDNAQQRPPVANTVEAGDQSKLEGLVPADTRKAYDVRRVIRGFADTGSVFEIKPTYAKNAVTAFVRLNGRPAGVIANQPMQLGGMLTSPACEKISHFVAICDAYGLPLVYLIDVPGFSIGSSAEKSQLGRRSARMIYELGHATVPRISVVLRKGYGLGYIAMCGGRSFDADACLAWPTSEICAMSLEGAANVAYRKQIEQADDPDARRRELIAEMRSRVSALRGAEGFGVDDIVAPQDTRQRLIEILDRAPARRENHLPPKVRSISPI